LPVDHYENFPVASWLLPARLRPPIEAIYGFARGADDVADEGDATDAERLAGLARYSQALDAIEANTPPPPGFERIAAAVRDWSLPIGLFRDLLDAFRQDVTTKRYATYAALLDYCRRSANPVGRLVLRIGGYADAALDRSSDALCTALQLTNFWQDFGRDWRAGRLYVPRDVQHACGADESDLQADRFTGAWICAIDNCIGTTKRLFADGRAVCDQVRGRLKFELRLTWHGGRRILERVEALRSDLLHQRPSLGAVDIAPLLWRAARWPRAAL